MKAAAVFVEIQVLVSFDSCNHASISRSEPYALERRPCPSDRMLIRCEYDRVAYLRLILLLSNCHY